MPDIVLVYPKTGFDIKGVSVDLPLSLLTIASTVSDRYSVKIIDQRTDKNWQQSLINEVLSKPLCVGITSMTGPQIEYALKITKLVKNVDPFTVVVWGGVHPSLLPEQTLDNENIDIVVVGEGELTFRELVDALSDKKDLINVKGLAIKTTTGVILTGRREFADLNELPELPYDLVDVEKYIGSQGRFRGHLTRSLIFISSRGCPWNCSYCCNPKLSKRKWRSMSAEIAYAKVSKLVERYNLDAITFHDEEFLVNQQRAKDIARLINGRFKWWIQARMDRLKHADLKLFSRMGLVSVQPGIESGSNRILRSINKGETTDDILEANKLMAKTKIIPLYNFMMGFPTETYTELMETVDISLQLLKDNSKAQVSGFYVLVPYPGTKMAEIAVREGFEMPRTLEQWAKYNRQHLKTPWLQDRMNIFKSLMVSSKFIDGTRLKNRISDAFGGRNLPNRFYSFLANTYRYRWRNRIFKPRLDQFINKIVLMLFKVSQI